MLNKSRFRERMNDRGHRLQISPCTSFALSSFAALAGVSLKPSSAKACLFSVFVLVSVGMIHPFRSLGPEAVVDEVLVLVFAVLSGLMAGAGMAAGLSG